MRTRLETEPAAAYLPAGCVNKRQLILSTKFSIKLKGFSPKTSGVFHTGCVTLCCRWLHDRATFRQGRALGGVPNKFASTMPTLRRCPSVPSCLSHSAPCWVELTSRLRYLKCPVIPHPQQPREEHTIFDAVHYSYFHGTDQSPQTIYLTLALTRRSAKRHCIIPLLFAQHKTPILLQGYFAHRLPPACSTHCIDLCSHRHGQVRSIVRAEGTQHVAHPV